MYYLNTCIFIIHLPKCTSKSCITLFMVSIQKVTSNIVLLCLKLKVYSIMDLHYIVDSFASVTQHNVWYTMCFVWVDFVLPLVCENKLLIIFLEQHVRSFFIFLNNKSKWYLNNKIYFCFLETKSGRFHPGPFHAVLQNHGFGG